VVARASDWPIAPGHFPGGQTAEEANSLAPSFAHRHESIFIEAMAWQSETE